MTATPVLPAVSAARAKADMVLYSLATMYSQEIVAGLYPAPTLIEDAYSAEFAIAWEEGPYEWALRLHGQADRELALLAVDAGLEAAAATRLASTGSLNIPAGVEVDPFYSFVLCIDVFDAAA